MFTEKRKKGKNASAVPKAENVLQATVRAVPFIMQQNKKVLSVSSFTVGEIFLYNSRNNKSRHKAAEDRKNYL